MAKIKKRKNNNNLKTTVVKLYCDNERIKKTLLKDANIFILKMYANIFIFTRKLCATHVNFNAII